MSNFFRKCAVSATVVAVWFSGSITNISVAGEKSNAPIYLDGETLAYYIGSASKGDKNPVLEKIATSIQFAWIYPGEKQTRVEVHLKERIHVEFKPRKSVKMGQVYGLELPPVVEFFIEGNDGDILATRLESIVLLAKVPLASDKVQLSTLRLDLASGSLKVEALAISGWVKLIAEAHFEKTNGASGPQTKMEWWETIVANIPTALYVGSFGTMPPYMIRWITKGFVKIVPKNPGQFILLQ